MIPWLYIKAAAAGVLILALSGCTQPAPPPPDTRAADVKAIRDLEDQNTKNWNAKDVAKALSFYSDDASVLMAGAPTLEGKAAIEAAMGPMAKDSGLALEVKQTKAEVAKSGDIGYTRGTYMLTTTDPKTKKLMMEHGKYVTVFQKQTDGSWKATNDAISPNGPPLPVTK